MKTPSQIAVKQNLRVYRTYANRTNLSDEELIIQIANRNIEALKQLFARYWDELYEITYKRVLSKSGTKKILVEVFEILWKNSKEVPGNYPVRSYLYSTLKCQIFLHYEQHPLLLKKIISTSDTTHNHQ